MQSGALRFRFLAAFYLFSLIGVIICAVSIQRRISRKIWYATLLGPFQGVVVKLPPDTSPSSRVVLDGNDVIEAINKTGSFSVITLKDSSSNTQWTMQLRNEPARNSHPEDFFSVKSVTLLGVENWRGTNFVIMKCNWGNGGDQRGALELNPRHQFVCYWLDW